MKVEVLVIQLYLTLCEIGLQSPWIAAHQALLSMEFSRQEYWSGLPFPSPGDLPSGDRTLVSHIAGRLYQLSHQGSLEHNTQKCLEN